MKHTVLVVDDEPTQRRLLQHVVGERLGYQVVTAPGGREAIDYILGSQSPAPDVVLLDLSMPRVNGFDVLRAVHPLRPDLPIVVLTMYGDIDKAVEAIHLGAREFLAKPVPMERLRLTLQNLLRLNALEKEVHRLQHVQCGQVFFNDMVGGSALMKDVKMLGERAAQSSVPVMVFGEQGVGKHLFARAVHGASPRADKPFVVVNCGALPEALAEGLLFGHERTNTMLPIVGKFREADGGTLLLDDIGELRLDLQAKLLRFLQTGSIEPVSGAMVKADVRIITATRLDVKQLVEKGQFREDLYYRLNVFPVRVPALRERREDITPLARHFCESHAKIEGKHIQGIDSGLEEELCMREWPGNVRELENTIFRAVLMCDSEHIEPQHMHAPTLTSSAMRYVMQANGHSDGESALPLTDDKGNLKRMIQIEAEVIKYALHHYEWHMSEVARRLGIGRSTLYRKMSDFGIAHARHPTYAKSASAM